MITPLDIQNKEFSKAVRGYREEEVDGFLDLVTQDLEKLMDENQRHKEQIRMLEKEISRYRNTEGMVLETLDAAKALMGDITASAEKRAEILLKNAQLDAELITREARESVDRLNEEILTMQNHLNVFRTRYKSLLESELNKFDTLGDDFFSGKDMEEFGFSEKTLYNFRSGDR